VVQFSRKQFSQDSAAAWPRSVFHPSPSRTRNEALATIKYVESTAATIYMCSWLQPDDGEDVDVGWKWKISEVEDLSSRLRLHQPAMTSRTSINPFCLCCAVMLIRTSASHTPADCCRRPWLADYIHQRHVPLHGPRAASSVASWFLVQLKVEHSLPPTGHAKQTNPVTHLACYSPKRTSHAVHCPSTSTTRPRTTTGCSTQYLPSHAGSSIITQIWQGLTHCTLGIRNDHLLRTRRRASYDIGVSPANRSRR
jgi:hypothetical protein